MRSHLYSRSHAVETITIVAATLAICASLKRSFRFYRYVFCHYLRHINWRLIFSASIPLPYIICRGSSNRFVLGAARTYLIIGELYLLCVLHAHAYILCLGFFEFINMTHDLLAFIASNARPLPSILSFLLFT